MPKTGTRKVRKPIALQVDKHVLYQEAVQDTESQYEFIRDTFEEVRNRLPLSIREDFCGTAKMCCEWVSGDQRHTAIGVDIDGEVLEWGHLHNVSPLEPEQQQRLSLIQEDVLQVKTDPVDAVVATNFSYYLFKERPTLKSYFKNVHASLVDDGLFILDAFGGSEAFEEMEESTEHDDFTYTWDQAKYDPISGHMTCHIHFSFKDRSRLREAFSYHWRVWTLPEIRELLEEAGFSKVTIYWEGTDEETGEGDGYFTPATEGEADPSWVCYIVAEK